MTRQQAGVSAERVVTTCLHCKNAPVQLGRAYCDECFHELLNGDCAAPGCKHEQALATAPPEAKPISAWIEQQQQTTPREMATAPPEQTGVLDFEKPGQISVNAPTCDKCGKIFLDCKCLQAQPQAVSAGALSVQDYVERFFAPAVEFIKQHGYRDWDGSANGQTTTLTGCANMLAEALAAHDQKVRRDAKWNVGAVKIWLYDILQSQLPSKESALMIANAIAQPLTDRLNMPFDSTLAAPAASKPEASPSKD